MQSRLHVDDRLSRCQQALMEGIPLNLQAATKLLLAEGSKVVMVASQSSYSQGIYGLVSNLGSLVVRTIFQARLWFAGLVMLCSSLRDSPWNCIRTRVAARSGSSC